MENETSYASHKGGNISHIVRIKREKSTLKRQHIKDTRKASCYVANFLNVYKPGHKKTRIVCVNRVISSCEESGVYIIVHEHFLDSVKLL